MLSLIAAVARNRAIGKDNQLLWHLPEDMKHFREITRGKPVIMGRKTWESLPERFRPLPGRLNIVVSRNGAYSAPGATLACSLDEALAHAGRDNEVFVIGGAELYGQALPRADRLYLTEIEQDFDADTFFPEVSPQLWQEESRMPGTAGGKPSYAFVIYRKR